MADTAYKTAFLTPPTRSLLQGTARQLKSGFERSMHSDNKYSIRPGVYFAAVQGEGVIMDLVEDCYYGLEAESAAIWSALEAGYGPARIAQLVSETFPIVDLDTVVLQLDAWKEARLLDDVSGWGEPPRHLPRARPLGTPARELLVPQPTRYTSDSWRMMPRLIRSALWARWGLKQRDLCWVLRHIQDCPVVDESHEPRQNKTIHRMLAAYRSCRRILAEGTDDCLIRSLALGAALRSLKVDAEVCFGVQKFPFLAHAWVEVGGKVANEIPQTIKKYTVIGRF